MQKGKNEQIVDQYRKRKVLRIIIILVASATLILSILSLFKKVPIIIPLLGLAIETILTSYRNKLDFKKESSSSKLPPH